MRRTRTGVFLRALAAARPPKPPPTMTTRGTRSPMGLIRLGVGLGLHTQSADGRAEHQETCPCSDDLPASPHAPPPSPHTPLRSRVISALDGGSPASVASNVLQKLAQVRSSDRRPTGARGLPASATRRDGWGGDMFQQEHEKRFRDDRDFCRMLAENRGAGRPESIAGVIC